MAVKITFSEKIAQLKQRAVMANERVERRQPLSEPERQQEIFTLAARAEQTSRSYISKDTSFKGDS